MTLLETINAAIKDITLNGYDSQKRINDWVVKIRQAAAKSLTPKAKLDKMLRASLTQVYKGLAEKDGIMKFHPGVSRFTIKNLEPKMKKELDKRIMASANLITLNREQSIDKTLQRFQGWATSIPAGGSKATDKQDAKESVGKALKQLPFEERRVLIDQGHKLTASINAVVAEGSGAIAMVWKSNWRQRGYDYREDHKDRDGEVYLIEDSWAHQKGFVKPGAAGYTKDITQPAEEPFCRCHGVYVYSIRKLPDDMVTAKGREAMAEARAKMEAMT